MHCEDFCRKLTAKLRQAFPNLKNPVRCVPTAFVMYELDQMMIKGEIPGYKDINSFYRDGIHLTGNGGYMIACTFVATHLKTDPHVFKIVTDCKKYQEFGGLNEAVAKRIQDAVWKVVQQESDLTGVSPVAVVGRSSQARLAAPDGANIRCMVMTPAGRALESVRYGDITAATNRLPKGVYLVRPAEAGAAPALSRIIK